MATPGGRRCITYVFQSDENVISLRLTKGPEGRKEGLEMGYYNDRLVLFSIVGLAA